MNKKGETNPITIFGGVIFLIGAIMFAIGISNEVKGIDSKPMIVVGVILMLIGGAVVKITT